MKYENLQDAIQIVTESKFAYCHYITPNDVGLTGGHQCGFHVAKSCYEMFFDHPCVRGSNEERPVEVRWQNDFVTQSMAKYYGVRTRNEYRLTRFGRDFEFLKEKYIGSLLVMTRKSWEEYNAYVLSDQDNIESFIASFNLNVTSSNQVINRFELFQPDQLIKNDLLHFIELHNDFPGTIEMAAFARECVINARNLTEDHIASKSDSVLLDWINVEYQLFKGLEEKIYRPTFSQPFPNCQSLIDFSNTILNRRKSRAGKSLEHHLSHVFTSAKLKFETQQVTENNKKPDFIFPNIASYHDFLFPADKLTMLGAKTTCKDRWRQVLNEADRIDQKHLFTLQCGITANQLKEMKDEHLTLVVPKQNMNFFPPEYQTDLLSLSDFIQLIRERQV